MTGEGPTRVTATYSHEPLAPPDEFVAIKDDLLAIRRRDAERNARLFFGGPTTRLIEWRPDIDALQGTGRESPRLSLHLGPVSWNEYQYLDEGFRRREQEIGSAAAYDAYIGLTEMVRDGSVTHSKLSNILVTATTIITRDG